MIPSAFYPIVAKRQVNKVYKVRMIGEMKVIQRYSSLSVQFHYDGQ